MTRKKILYLDDETLNLDLFSEILDEHYEILTAPNGPDGIRLLKDNKDIEAVITDFNMPEMNGLEFVREAKGINQNISYYLLTGYEITNEIEQALSEGLIKRCFKKPFNLLKIRDEILS